MDLVPIRIGPLRDLRLNLVLFQPVSNGKTPRVVTKTLLRSRPEWFYPTQTEVDL